MFKVILVAKVVLLKSADPLFQVVNLELVLLYHVEKSFLVDDLSLRVILVVLDDNHGLQVIAAFVVDVVDAQTLMTEVLFGLFEGQNVNVHSWVQGGVRNRNMLDGNVVLRAIQS